MRRLIYCVSLILLEEGTCPIRDELKGGWVKLKAYKRISGNVPICFLFLLAFLDGSRRIISETWLLMSVFVSNPPKY